MGRQRGQRPASDHKPQSPGGLNTAGVYIPLRVWARMLPPGSGSRLCLAYSSVSLAPFPRLPPSPRGLLQLQLLCPTLARTEKEQRAEVHAPVLLRSHTSQFHLLSAGTKILAARTRAHVTPGSILCPAEGGLWRAGCGQPGLQLRSLGPGACLAASAAARQPGRAECWPCLRLGRGPNSRPRGADWQPLCLHNLGDPEKSRSSWVPEQLVRLG